MEKDRRDQEWNDLEVAILERTVRPHELPDQTTQRVLEENSPHAALVIIEIARNGHSERVRLDAAKYIIDRTLGRIGEARTRENGKKDPIEDLYDLVTRDATAAEAAAIKNAQGKLGGNK